jgi:hypothetical protein
MTRVTNPSTSRLTALVTEELEVIPRGDFYQNMYRMIYEQVRLNGLGCRAQIAGSVTAAHKFALRAVREQQPDFAPELMGS